MQRIIDKYADTGTGYLLPIIRAGSGNDRLQYQNAMRLVNNKLKQVAVLAGMSGGLTMYVTRHSWASIAPLQAHPPVGDKRRHGSRQRGHHANLPRLDRRSHS